MLTFQLDQRSYSVDEDSRLVNVTLAKIGENERPVSVLLQTQEIQNEIVIARGTMLYPREYAFLISHKQFSLSLLATVNIQGHFPSNPVTYVWVVISNPWVCAS